ncbi:hypothetical protein GCK72_001034 [Caenorhabditis remanei]|nr:hypothetical protein GCK72_001034 [Caenorhabditis remanei]KAF1769220.1 hypothetical protein GCK72_001034 [Caenorhabditis remanei]
MASNSTRLKVWEENCPVLKDTRFQRKYQVLEDIIGEGSFGTVIRAKCRATQTNRAIKAIRRIEKVNMLSIELELLSELGGHFNIVKLYEFFHFNGSVALVLEYFPHCSANELLYRTKQDLSFGLKYIENLLSAVAYLHHNGYVHRDVKLSNFLYSPQTNKFRLVDFGLATNDRSKNENSRKNNVAALNKDPPCTTCNGSSTPCMFCKNRPKREIYHIVGTPGVRAPELLFGVGLCNTAVDVFSCGIVLLSLICVKHPFFTPKDETENIYDLAFLLGSKTIEDMAKNEGLRVTLSEKLPPVDYYKLVMSLRYGFNYVSKNILPAAPCKMCYNRSYNNSKGVCFCRTDYETNMYATGEHKIGKKDDELMTVYVDLLYRSLEADRFKRYNADQLLCIIDTYRTRAAYVAKPIENDD